METILEEISTTLEAVGGKCAFTVEERTSAGDLDVRVRGVGRRGGKGTWIWSREAMDAFVEARPMLPCRQDVQARLARTEARMEAQRIKQWGSWIAAKPIKPGVFRKKEGGFLVRGRVTDP